MKMSPISIALIVILCLTAEIKAQNSLDLEYKGEIVLTDSVHAFFQSSLSEFKEDNDTLYIISPDNSSFSAYSLTTGKQLHYEHLQGRGPFEMEYLYNISISEKSFYLLDYSGKIIEFDKSKFSPQNEFQSTVTRAKALHKNGDDFIISHESPSHKTYLLNYNHNSNTISEIGPKQRFENIMLSAFKHGGQFIEAIKGELLITVPFGSKLYRLNTNDYSMDSIFVDIPEFKQTQKDLENQLYFQNPEELQNFFIKNSLITGIYNIDNAYLIEVYHLHRDYSRGIAIFNNTFELQCYGEVNDPEIYDGTKEPKIRFSDGEFIYFYREEMHRTEQDSVDKVLTYFKPSCN